MLTTLQRVIIFVVGVYGLIQLSIMALSSITAGQCQSLGGLNSKIKLFNSVLSGLCSAIGVYGSAIFLLVLAALMGGVAYLAVKPPNNSFKADN